jgi:hypothetical protein
MLKSRKHKNKPSINGKQLVVDPGHELRLPPIRKKQKKSITLPNEKDYDDDDTIVESDADESEYLDDEDVVELYDGDESSGCTSSSVSFLKRFIFLYVIIFLCIMVAPIIEPFVMKLAPSQLRYPIAIVSFIGALIASISIR